MIKNVPRFIDGNLVVSSRNKHCKCCVKKGVLKNFAKFTGKYLCWSLFFNKVEGLRPATSLKKKLQHRSFPMNLAISFYTFFTEHLRKTACAIYNYSLKYSETSSFTKLVTRIKSTYNFITLARTINTTELLLRTCHMSIMEHFCEKDKLLFAIKLHHICVTKSYTILGELNPLTTNVLLI